jgi:NSS family neurotransmitter:Na+ symporter
MDFVSIIITPFGAVLGAISVYYILGWDEIRKELEQGHGKLSEMFGTVAKYLYVPLTVIIMVLGLIYGGL